MSRFEHPGRVCIPLGEELEWGDGDLTRHSPPSAETPQGPRCIMFPSKGLRSEHGREEETTWLTSLQLRHKEKPGPVETEIHPRVPSPLKVAL